MLKALTLMLSPVPTNSVIPQLPNKSRLHHIMAMDHDEAAEESKRYYMCSPTAGEGSCVIWSCSNTTK